MEFKIKRSKNSLDIFDAVTGFPIFQDALSYSYTLKSDDITIGQRSADTTPYDSRKGEFESFQENSFGDTTVYSLRSGDGQTELSITPFGKALRLFLTTKRLDFSEFGLNLPFNFMGKFNGGGHLNQYLFNSPYRSSDNQIKFCYLSNLNGRNLVVAFLSKADGWKMDYSKFLGGHYFDSLKCLANFDKAYNTSSKYNLLCLELFFVKDYYDAVKKVAKLLKKPMLYYDKSYSLDGCGVVKVVGDCDYVEMQANGKVCKLIPERNRVYFSSAEYKTTFTPYFNGVRGGDCSVYGYKNIFKLWEKANDFVNDYNGQFIPDDNACEGQCWVESLLRFGVRFGDKNSYAVKLKEHLTDVLMQVDPKKARSRATVLAQPFENFPAYHIFKSTRIQEQFSAVSIFLNAYKYFGEKKYLDYCLNTLDTLITYYQKPDGRIERPNGYGVLEDYSTVTCLILAVIDVAVFVKKARPKLYSKYAGAAKKLAEFIYKRGFSFPTEGEENVFAEEEFEDGSISCSALSLLYYCKKIERVQEYMDMAKQILDFHEAWVMRTPDCNVYRSSLRWWETRWEGDADGPGLCCGHGWTIWRAEADYWYYKLTGKKEYLIKSLCSFTTNFAKFNHVTGQGKSIYSMDYIPGGGLGVSKDKVKFRIALGLPNDVDVRLAYYVFSRADATIFNEKFFKD